MISAGGGEKESLGAIQEMFKMGVATKEDYTQALRAYQAYLGEIKSVQRNEAAAADEEFKYYYSCEKKHGGYVTKDYYTKAFRLYQSYVGKINY